VVNLVSEGTIEHRMLETLASKQALADGVLELRGDLKEIRFKGGRQALLARLQQMLGPAPSPTGHEAERSKVLPVDRALAFSSLAAEKLRQALVRCEERYPLEGSHSVLVAVVDADAALWREKLMALHKEVFANGHSDPLSRIEVIDRGTDEALKRMIDAGLIVPATRAIRPLYCRDGDAPAAIPLSDSEKQKALAYRQKSSRKLKMALLLEGGGLVEEAREATLETVLLLGRALAVENRVPEPAELNEALQAPLSLYWSEALPAISEFAVAPSSPASQAVKALQKIADSMPR
jgi:hypothetical protein